MPRGRSAGGQSSDGRTLGPLDLQCGVPCSATSAFAYDNQGWNGTPFVPGSFDPERHVELKWPIASSPSGG